ncbi:MAG TPA: oligosaccharide flippase family protein [Candidatus Dormibacteraeota bacterium]|jgi:O-antigen/teichoic acid export membrane protein|nr:oligosaccharide flippase family protein [Candidatus Dormibacteraeota bacterium]
MSLKIRALKNVASSWGNLGINVAVGFFLYPFILHHLGDDASGLWILIFSLTGYYGIFDFGIRSSLVRYVSKFQATGDKDQLARLVNTSLFTYTCLGLILVVPTVLGSLYVDRLFHIPAGFLRDAQVLFLMVGLSLALGFPLGVSGGILEGLQRFYLLNWTNIAATVLRAVLIIYVLRHGFGLLSVALITVTLPLVAAAVRAVIAQRLLVIPYGWKYVDRESLRQVVTYGSVTFMIIVASRLRFKTDAVIIGTFLSAAAITHFSIGARLVDYAGEVVSSLAQIFTPMSSHFHATGDYNQLRKIFISGNRACALVMFPMTVALVVMGKSVIEAWVGQRYVSSYIVLLILLIPSTLYQAQSTSNRILFGMSLHKSLAYIVLMEGIANVILSIVLVRPLGIVGDAIGTAIPLLCTSLVFLPRHMCRQLGVPVRKFLVEAYFYPVILCIPMILVLILMQHSFYAHRYPQLILNLLAGVAAYGVGVLWFILTREPLGIQLRTRMSRYFGGQTGEPEL